MSPFQMIMLALGVLLGVSTYWEQIKSLLTKPSKVDPDPTPEDPTPEDPTPEDPTPEDPKKPDHRHDPLGSLAEVVVCWENLQDELKERGLHKAAAELTAIFPLFIDAVKEEDVKPQSGA